MIYFLREEDMANIPTLLLSASIEWTTQCGEGDFYRVASRVGRGWRHCLIDVCDDPHFPCWPVVD